MDMFLDDRSIPTATPLKNGIPFLGRRKQDRLEPPLRIGIVNNMPDSALVATERQFTTLVRNTSGGPVDISLYFIPGLPRGDDARTTLASRYRPISELDHAGLDALVITGNEPRAARLDEEPYWQELTGVIDWARTNTRSTLWSCLAAHAAILHLDGIERRRLPQKKHGVLPCSVSALHRQFLPETLAVCHSRLNEAPKEALVAAGYEILSEAPVDHVDIFAKDFGSRFLFLQGHPEYDADSLMREYRRDVGRFLNGYRETYPEVPEHYFDSDTVIRMANYRHLAERTRDIRLFESFPPVTLRAGLEDMLAQSAAAIFRFWLAEVRALTAAG